MKISSAVLAIVVIAIALLIYGFEHNGASAAPTPAESNTLLNSRFNTTGITIVNNGTARNYSAYAAITDAQQQQGYMNVTSLGNCDGKSNCIGMLFEFANQSNECFWMKNTAMPLRQTWLNSSGYAVYTYEATPYSTNAICHEGMYVIETAPNFSVYGRVLLNSTG